MDIKFSQSTYDIVLQEDALFVDLAITNDTSEDLMQRLFFRFKTYPKDLFWNIRYGVDYLNRIFGINKPKFSVDAIILDEINKEVLVKEVTYFVSSVVNYSYSCQFTVTTAEDNQVVEFYLLTNENGITLTDSLGNKLTAMI